MTGYFPHTVLWLAAIGQAYTAYEVERTPWNIRGYPRLSRWLTRICIWAALFGLLLCVYVAGMMVPQ